MYLYGMGLRGGSNRRGVISLSLPVAFSFSLQVDTAPTSGVP